MIWFCNDFISFVSLHIFYVYNFNFLEQSTETQQKSETDNEKLADSEYLQTLIDKIHILKKEIIAENEKLGNPIDITTVFKVEGYENIHLKCREEYENLKMEFDEYKKQKVRDSGSEVENEVGDLKSEIAVLKEKVEAYKIMYEEEKQDKLDSLKLCEEVCNYFLKILSVFYLIVCFCSSSIYLEHFLIMFLPGILTGPRLVTWNQITNKQRCN